MGTDDYNPLNSTVNLNNNLSNQFPKYNNKKQLSQSTLYNNKINQNKEKNLTHENVVFINFCGNTSNQEVITNKKKIEIDLTTTYTSVKGTYTNESIRLFSEKEKYMFYLVQNNNISGIRYLIIQGVNINILDEERTSPLHVACKESSIQTIEEIIFQGAMINIPDLVGWTPLHMACYYNRPDVVLLLLKSGANYQTRNRDKLSPKDLAINLGNNKCVRVLDKFIQYQKIEKQKCLQEININDFNTLSENNEDIFEDILKKYITYQKLKGEYMQNNEGICNENEINISRNTDDSNIDLVNDEIFPTAEIQKNSQQKIKINQIEKCLNLLSLQISNRKDRKSEFSPEKNIFIRKNNELLSKYKCIPKKHKFYLKYGYIDNNFVIKNKDKYNKIIENDNINGSGTVSGGISSGLIHYPTSMPLMSSMENLNSIKKLPYNSNKEKTKVINDAEEEKELYRPYNIGDDQEEENNKESIDSEEYIRFDSPLKVLNKKESVLSPNFSINNEINISEDVSDEDGDKTVRIDDECINFHINYLEDNKNKDQKVLLQPFILNKTPDKNLKKYFLKHNDIYEELLQILLHFDYVFGIQFLMSISDIKNSLVSLINYVSNNIYNSRLRLEILNLMNYKKKSSVLESYFNLLNYKNNTIFQNIKKIFKLFDLSSNDIKLIDQLSSSFAQAFYSHNKNNSLFNSQNAVYFFVFSFIVTKIAYSQNINNKEKIICDMILMLRYLNEGENYDNNLIKESVSEIKKNDITITNSNKSYDYSKKLINVQLRRDKDNVLTSYNCYFYNGIFIILNAKKEIIQLINLQLDNNISCTLIPHSYKICFTSLQNNIIEIINKGTSIVFQKSLFFEIYIPNVNIMNSINKYFDDKKRYK